MNIENTFNSHKETDYYNCSHKIQIVINVFPFSKGCDVSRFIFFYRTIPKLSTCFNCANVLTLP